MKTGKKLLSVLLSLLLVLGAVSVGGMIASADDPVYMISSYADLQAFASRVNSGDVSACAKLMNDIDASASDPGLPGYDPSNAWTPIGMDNNHIYIGTFDGNGRVIIGLSNSGVTDMPQYAGLFGYIGSKTEGGVTTKGTVKNVGLVGGSITGNNYVGGVAGYNNGGSVTNCYNTGDVSGNKNVGGVVGQNLDNSKVSNCYNTGNVSGNDSVGGVVGANYMSSTISNCYNTGSITATGDSAYVGGVAGQNIFNFSSVSNCYFDSDRAPGISAIGEKVDATSSNVKGLTTAQMTGENALRNMVFE
ncbi:MAG: hypothetical protein IJM02_01325, partial [Clostridia bacterium]|nr:hypothetical protein [Clostridia bacterium]